MTQPRRKYVYEVTMTVFLEADRKTDAEQAVAAIIQAIKPRDPASRYWRDTMVLDVMDVARPGRRPEVFRFDHKR